MTKQATLYRMHNTQHICPYGLRAKKLLEDKGFSVSDHRFKGRTEVDAFKQENDVKTTPQIFIEGERIGGYDALRTYLGMGPLKKEGKTYTPVLMIFLSALLLTIATNQSFEPRTLLTSHTIMNFIAFSMVLLAVQKLKDLHSFVNSFITYDLLAMRQLNYGYLYPFLELYAGLGMLAKLPVYMVAPVSLAIGTIGAISVFKAVYLDKRELTCACVGGQSNVPLGFVSLTENLFMIGAASWMLSSL